MIAKSKWVRCLATPMLALILLSGSAMAQQAVSESKKDAHFYSGVHFGYNSVEKWNNIVKFGNDVQIGGQVVSDGAGVGGLTIGYQKLRNIINHQAVIRYELEYQHGWFDIKSLGVGLFNEAASKTGRYEALTFNAYYQEHWNVNFSGYAGLGVGWGQVNLPHFALSNDCHCMGKASSSSVALLARAGLEYNLKKRHNVFVQYTFMNLGGPSSDSTLGVNYSNKLIGAVSVGYRYLF